MLISHWRGSRKQRMLVLPAFFCGPGVSAEVWDVSRFRRLFVALISSGQMFVNTQLEANGVVLDATGAAIREPAFDAAKM